MTTRPYDDCLAMALALCGIPDANTMEVGRVAVYLNGRARKAYNASTYWPRWLKVEERVCSEDGLIPYEEDGLDTIKVALRVHATEPYKDAWAAEYGNYVAQAGGIQVAGYEASAYTGYADMVVSGSVIPETDGTYEYLGQSSPGFDGVTTAPTYARADNTNYVITPSMIFTLGGDLTGYQWSVGWVASGNFWQSDTQLEYLTPDLADGNYTGQGFASPDITVTAVPTYSVWVTYKAAFTTTYASGDEVPEEWFDYMAHGAYADWLRGEGQQEKAPIAEAEAQEKLSEQLEMIDRQSGSHVFTRVINHANTQQR